jgi:hypothetical protein
MSSLSAYGEKFPVGGRFAYKKAGIGVREKPQGYAAGFLETFRTVSLREWVIRSKKGRSKPPTQQHARGLLRGLRQEMEVLVTTAAESNEVL